MTRPRFVHASLISALLIAILSGTAPTCAADSTHELLLQVPPSANAVAVVNVEVLFKSQLGTKSGWSRTYYTDYANGVAAFPPSVQMAVLAAKIDPETIHADWELSVVRLKSPFAMKKLAEKESAPLEKLEGRSLVTTERRTSFVEIRPQTLAVTNQKNRQDIARWLRGTRDATQPQISEYLLDAVTDPKGQYHLALDLQDVVPFDYAKARLQTSPALKGQTVDFDALAKLAVGLRGLRVSIDVGETIEGTLRIDLTDEIAQYARLLPPIALSALQRNGVFIDELSNAKVEFAEKSFTFHTTLSESSLRRIISLIQPSVGQLDVGASDGSWPPVPGSVLAEQAASIRFYKTIQTQLNDLETNARRAKNDTSSAHWFQTYARLLQFR